MWITLKSAAHFWWINVVEPWFQLHKNHFRASVSSGGISRHCPEGCSNNAWGITPSHFTALPTALSHPCDSEQPWWSALKLSFAHLHSLLSLCQAFAACQQVLFGTVDKSQSELPPPFKKWCSYRTWHLLSCYFRSSTSSSGLKPRKAEVEIFFLIVDQEFSDLDMASDSI